MAKQMFGVDAIFPSSFPCGLAKLRATPMPTSDDVAKSTSQSHEE